MEIEILSNVQIGYYVCFGLMFGLGLSILFWGVVHGK